MAGSVISLPQLSERSLFLGLGEISHQSFAPGLQPYVPLLEHTLSCVDSCAAQVADRSVRDASDALSVSRCRFSRRSARDPHTKNAAHHFAGVPGWWRFWYSLMMSFALSNHLSRLRTSAS